MSAVGPNDSALTHSQREGEAQGDGGALLRDLLQQVPRLLAAVSGLSRVRLWAGVCPGSDRGTACSASGERRHDEYD